MTIIQLDLNLTRDVSIEVLLDKASRRHSEKNCSQVQVRTFCGRLASRCKHFAFFSIDFDEVENMV